jgi:tetratricopeptide (TPR) repeat protein
VSKTHELRKKALEAVRDRDWDRAVKFYERICTVDSGNGSPRNELGDIYLKIGDVENAIAQFQEGARLYQEFGLTNNAVAVHKKILRHDPNHLHSLWVLGEIRLAQGLEAEASTAFMDFLARAENVAESERDAFVARALQLLDRLGDDPEILSRLDAIFAHYDRGQERAQVLVAKARLAHEAGEFEVRDKYVEHARAAFSYLDALPDFVRLRSLVDGAPTQAEDVATQSTAEVANEATRASSTDGEERFELGDEDLQLEPPSGISASLPMDALDIDLGFDFDETELSGAVDRVSGSTVAVEPVAAIPPVPDPEETMSPEPEPSTASGQAGVDFTDVGAQKSMAEPVAAAAAEEATVDLLSEILADESFDSKEAEQRQIATIEEEMRGQIGGQAGADDHAAQYDLGIVYMDMGLFEQAAEAFARASAGESDRLRAIEMQGTCLLRLGRSTEAMAAFQSGLAVPGYPGRSYLGLLYGVGLCHEAEGRAVEAIDYLERVAAVDDGFLDVGSRLQGLRGDHHV